MASLNDIAQAVVEDTLEELDPREEKYSVTDANRMKDDLIECLQGAIDDWVGEAKDKHGKQEKA